MASTTIPSWREQAGLGQQRQTGTVANDDCADWTAAYQLFPGDVAYIWHAGVHAAEVASGIRSAGFSIRASNHLGQAALCHEPRPLSLAT